MLGAKRMREHAALFGSLLAVVAIVSGLGVGMVGYLADATTQGVRAQFAQLDGADLAFEVSLRRLGDGVEQDANMRQVIAETFAVDGKPVPLVVTRTLGALGPVAVRLEQDADAGQVIVQSIPDLAEVAELVAGTWPAGPAEASMEAEAARITGVAPGDTVYLGPDQVPFTLTGTWRVLDPLAARWRGEPPPLGSPGGRTGPFVIDESAWTGLTLDPRSFWLMTPVVDEITAADVAVIASAGENFNAVLRADGRFDNASYGREGRLPRVAVQVLDRLEALSAVQPVALLIAAAIAAIALIELARLLGGVRAGEIELLWSRGAAPTRIAAATAVEAGLVALVGAALGAAAAAGLLSLTGASVFAATGAALWAIPAGTALVVAGIFALSGLLTARRQAKRDTGVRSGRARTIAGAGAAVLVSVAAAVSSWQLLLYGTPLTPRSGGGTEVDPLAVLAPALVLVAIVLVALVAFPLVAPLVERAASADAGVTRVLTARNVSRRLQFAATPIVLVGLACGQVVLAAGYDSTWSTSYDTTAQLRRGAPVQVQFGRDGADAAGLDAVAAAPGVTASAPVASENVSVGTEFATLIAASAPIVATIANTGLGVFDRDAAASLIEPAPWSPRLPDGQSLVLVTSGSPPAGATVHLVDDAGRLSSVPLRPDPDGSFEAELPEPSLGAWSIEAVDFAQTPALRLESIAVDGVEVTLGPWWVALPMREDGRFGEALPADDDGLGYSEGSAVPGVDVGDGLAHPGTSGDVRMVPAFNGGATDLIAVSVVISDALARQFRLRTGIELTIGVDDFDVRTVIAGSVPAIPGAREEAALLMDLRTLAALRLRHDVEPPPPNRVWAMSSDGAATVAALRQELPVGTRFESAATDRTRAILGSAVTALWAGAVGAVALAVLAVGAVAGAQLRSRRDEVVVLRAVGVDAARQAGIRRLELGALLLYGLTAGVLAGAASALLTIASLARAAVPQRYTSLLTVTEFDPVLLLAGLGALIAALVAAVLVYGARVADQARTLQAREVLL